MHDVTRRIAMTSEGTVAIDVPVFAIEVVSGPDAGGRASSTDGLLTVGTSEDATLVLADPTVSRFHLELEAVEDGIIIRDLGSTNGTRHQSLMIREVITRSETELELGATRLRLVLGGGRSKIASTGASCFGRLIGGSAPMRAVYQLLAQAAPTTASVLITGESGTGKEVAARAVHEASPRAKNAFEIVDCGGLPPTLIESELFGHEKGAFTGAIQDHDGAFERADGGTLFLDELGELPFELQPKLLRALGEREIRRVGARASRRVDVRVVAATNRDLRREVNAGRFRADLYYRLAVIQVHMPALRERIDDLPELARALLDAIGKERELDVAGIELPSTLWRHAWPGNVRELRNYLEQLAILKMPPELENMPLAIGDDALLAGLDGLPFAEARDKLVARFESRYLARALEQTGGNVTEAARISGISRATLFRRLQQRRKRESSQP